jgi:hypothetical protein
MSAVVVAVLEAGDGASRIVQPWPQITISTADRSEYRADDARAATRAAPARRVSATSRERPSAIDAMFAGVRATGPRTSSAVSSLCWLAVALGGLLVGVVALSSEPGHDGSDSPASRLLIALPHEVVTLASIAGLLAILLWFAFLLALARRRGKDGEVERALWGALFFSLIVTAVAFWHRDVPEGLLFRWSGRQAATDQLAVPAGPEPPTVSLPLFTGAVSALMIVAALASLGLAGLVLFGDRLAEWWGRPATAGRRPLAVAVEESLDDLLGEGDARLAIIRCYRRFEDALARSRVPRAPWQTPLEFMRDALARLPLPSDAVERLTRLFERARFGNEPLAPVDRDAAWGSLLEIRRSLETTKERDGHAG